MKKVVVLPVIALVFGMMGANSASALDVAENINIASRGMLILIVLQVIFLFVGASIAKIDQRTFGKAILATLGIAAFFFFTFLVTAEKGIEGFGLVVAGLLSVIVIQKVFDTTLMKALGALLFTLISDCIAMLFIPGM